MHNPRCGGGSPRDEPSGRIGPTAVGPRPAMNPTGRIGPTAVGPRPAMNPAGRLFPKQSADCVGTPSYFIDLPGVNPSKSSRATGRAPQKRRRAGDHGYASHGGTMFPRAPPPASRRGLAPSESAAAFVPSWLPVAGFHYTHLPGSPGAIFLPPRFPPPPVLAVRPCGPSGGV